MSFVECIKLAVMPAVFNKSGSFDAAGALQNLSLIKPDVVLSTLLDKWLTWSYYNYVLWLKF